MAAEFDGDIQLVVDLTPGDVKETSRALEQQIKEIFKNIEGLDVSTKFEKLEISLAHSVDNASILRQKLDLLSKQTVPTEDFQMLLDLTEDLHKQLDPIEEKLNSWREQGLSDTDLFKEENLRAQEFRDNLAYVQSEMEEFRKAGIDVELAPGVAEKMNEVSSRLNDANNKTFTLRNQLIELAKEEGYIKDKSIKKLGTSAKNAAGHVASLARRLLQLAKARVSGILNKIGNGIKNLGKRAKDSAKGVGISFRQMLSYAIGIQGLFALFGKLRGMMQEGFKNLAQVSAPVNNAISSIISAFATLKNSLASAFAPILTTVAPIITKFINLLSAAINRVGMFIAALTGQKTYTRALPVVTDYAESLNGTAKGAENAASATQDANNAAEEYKKTLAGFDDVNILQGPDKKADVAVPEVAPGAGVGEQFEEAAIDSKIGSIADKIKDLIKNQDWEGLGILLASKINGIVDKLYRFLTDPELKKKIEQWVTAITSTFNSLIEHINFDKIGRVFGAGLNLINFTLNEFFKRTNWEALGSGFANTINGFFDEVDWDLQGETIANGCNSILFTVHGFLEDLEAESIGFDIGTMIGSFFDNLSWSTIGGNIFMAFLRLLDFMTGILQSQEWEKVPGKIVEKIREFFSEWEPSELFTALGRFAGALVSAIINFVKGAWKMQVSLYSIIKNYFVEKIKDAGWDKNNTLIQNGKAIIKGIFKGITDALKNVGEWIYKNILEPFINGFKDTFKINSPSKEMEPMGRAIIEGMFSGITGKLNNSGSWIKTNIFDKFKGGIDDSFGINENEADAVKNAGEAIVNGIYTGANNIWNTVPALFSAGADEIMSQFDWQDWGSIGLNIVGGIQEGIESGWSWLINTVSNLASSLFNTACYTLGIESPSKLFREGFGKMIPAGAAIGIEQATPEVLDAMDSMTTSIAKSAQDTQLPMSFDTELSGKFDGLQTIGDTFLLQFGNIIDRMGEIINGGTLNLPAVVSGGVVPYKAQAVPNTAPTTGGNTVPMDELRDIIETAIRKYMNIQFCIEDEQIARHAQSGAIKLNRRFNP